MLLVQALAAFQLSYGSFAAATLVALIGAVLGMLETKVYSHTILVLALGFLVVAIGGLATGAGIVVRETRVAMRHLEMETQFLIDTLPAVSPEAVLPGTPLAMTDPPA